MLTFIEQSSKIYYNLYPDILIKLALSMDKVRILIRILAERYGLRFGRFGHSEQTERPTLTLYFLFLSTLQGHGWSVSLFQMLMLSSKSKAKKSTFISLLHRSINTLILNLYICHLYTTAMVTLKLVS